MTEDLGSSRGGIRAGIARLFRLPLRHRALVDAEATAELQAFLAERIEDLVRQGFTRDDARAEALRRLGHSFTDAARLLQHSARTRERHMSMRELVDDLRQDLRYALRTLRRDRAFTFFAILVAGLGIGASVTVFSIVNGVLIRPLPVRDADRLVWIANSGSSGLSGATVQAFTVTDVRAEARSVVDVAAYFPFYEEDNMAYTSGPESVRLTAVGVTGNFFPMLGVTPMLGRAFNAEESGGGGSRVVMLSHLAWQRRFASDVGIIGKSLTLDNEPVTVVGVLPSSFDFASVFVPGTRVDVFTPFPLIEATNRWGNTLSMIGRLAPDATLASAAAEFAILGPRMTAAHPDRNAFRPALVTLKEHVSGRVQAALVILLVSVGVVMVIVCANLSHLLLARGSTRQKEVAVRLALGAGRARLARQLLTESSVLAVGGAVFGLLVATAGTRMIASLSTFSIPLLETVSVDATALGFAALLTLVAGLGFGLAPALRIPAADVNSALKSSGRGTTGGRRGRWTRDALIVSEIALACVLVIAAGLLTRSFLKVLEVNPGFRPERVASVRVDPRRENLVSEASFTAYVNELLARTRAMPGVQSAALADRLPLGSNRTWGAGVLGVTYARGSYPVAFVRVISDGYISTMGMKLVSGRDFTPEDDFSREKLIIINETMERALFGGESGLGRVIRADGNRRVVGVVGDVRHMALDAAGGNEMYLSYRQTSDFSGMHVVARTTMSPAAFTGALHDALKQVVPNLPAKDFQTLQQRVDRSLSPRRFTMALLNGFALFAVLLALIGIHGVVSYTVNQRTQELGVRMALGASATTLQIGIIRSTVALAALGMLLGSVASWATVRWMSGFLYGVTATDPVTFAIMLGTLTIVAVVSGFLPARRVSRIDPITSLRSSA